MKYYDLAYRTSNAMTQILRTLTLISNQQQHRKPRDSNKRGNNRDNINNNNSQRNKNNRGNKGENKFKKRYGIHRGQEGSEYHTNPNKKS